MGTDRTVYIGCYLKVWMPLEKYTDGEGECPACHKKTRAPFCANCGGKPLLIEKERMKYFGDLLLEVFGDEDYFSHVIPEDGNYILVIAKRRQELHVHIDDELEYELPGNSWSGNWQTLIDAFVEKKIEFARKFGVVNYWR